MIPLGTGKRYALNLLSVPATSRLIFSWCLTITVSAMSAVTSNVTRLPPSRDTANGMTAAAEIEPRDT